MALAGTVLGGRYELDEQVGSGGYCEVWRATDTVLSRLVAVKLLHPGYAGKAEALARFQAEALTAIVVASVAGFAPGWHPPSVPSLTPPGPSHTTVAPVRTAGSAGSSQDPSPGGQQAAGSPAAQPLPGQASAITSAKPGRKRGQGHGNGHGNGNGNAQTDSTSG